jgi:hypothetical protein
VSETTRTVLVVVIPFAVIALMIFAVVIRFAVM